MKFTYKQRIFSYFFLIFVFFTVCIVIFEQGQEKKSKTETLEAKLDGYAELIHSYIGYYNLRDTSITRISRLDNILPDNIRITIVNNDGKVLFDKDIDNHVSMDNHLDRPEIINALYSAYGSNIRMSASTRQEYLYYAKHYPDYFVRVALPYNVETQGMLKPDNMFIYIVGALFIVVLLFINYIAGRFSKSIVQLKNFTTRIRENQLLPDEQDFPEDELGEIGSQLVDIFKQMEAGKRNLEVEREKLIRHFQFAGEGLSFFSKDFKKIFTNTHFIQYLNLILDKPTFDVEDLFKDKQFERITDFINTDNREVNHFTYQITKNGKVFSIQTIAFNDKSFEITITDITKAEKTRLLKQEMTNNIAHELRTPVTGLRGYLETLSGQELDKNKQKQFIDRAYLQSVRLSNLIEDVSMISKIEEASSQFSKEKINVSQIINEVRIDLTDKLINNHIRFFSSVKDGLTVTGNYTLLYSVFRNLVDNSISYGGANIEIHIDNYMEDDSFLYFSYYDTGTGVAEQHLNRLFERFYRVTEGRTRDTGGSGLGLSIVKNAILLHQGNIQVKNRVEGGLEFLFTLKK